MEKTDMIGVYATCQVKQGFETEFENLVKQFITESRTHQGCQNYDCGAVTEKARTYCFIERWTAQTDLDAHLASPFFQQNAPKLIEMLENGLDINVVNFI
ncbi:putative quinol monooxygenase [Rodentibacter caecimuris]|uniref:putative quinol monooxygenase n=1 Tax=Rodentibacter caecimuris TaxID=1796644 RepID=UPI001F3EB282|nr:putative quinol monooxygenase [Rodentibacter heylii]MCX2960170.1 antibiotic biosynthesis monooxygenase [Rodentibacter heylii]